MPSSLPCAFPVELLETAPTAPSREPQIYCLKSQFLRLRKDVPQILPAASCIQCVLNRARIYRNFYEPVSGHCLEISRIDADYRCHSCSNALAIAQSPSECDYCRGTHESLLEYVAELGLAWKDLDEVTRVRSGPPPPLIRVYTCNLSRE